MKIEKELLTEKDIENLGLRAASTLRNERWQGISRIPFIKIGRSVRYRKEDVLKFIEDNLANSKTTKKV
jgi:hypothetical protein